MAGAGYKLFNTGDVLTAAQVNTYLQEQVVMVFANATARTTALSGVLAEGMVSYLKDTDAVEKYDGSAWVALVAGDIESVTASSPLTGGGSSGAVTIGIQDGTTAQKGAVQLEDSTSSTSTTKAATPNSVKSAYDLANAAIPKSIIDAAGDLIIGTADNTSTRLAIGTNGYVLKSNGTTAAWAVDPTTDVVTAAGDLIYATAADTVTRLGIGTAGQVLTVNSGATAPEWATSSSGGYTLISSQTMASVSSVTFSSIPGTYQDLVLILRGYYASSGTPLMQWEINSDTTTTNYIGVMDINRTGTSENQERWNTKAIVGSGMTYTNSSTSYNFLQMRIPNYTNTVSRKFAFTEGMQLTDYSATNRVFVYGMNSWSDTSAITAIKILNSSANNWTDGTALLYGVK